MSSLLNWNPMTKYVQFVFEDGLVRPSVQEQVEQENGGHPDSRGLSKDPAHLDFQSQDSYEPSHVIVDFEKGGQEFEMLEITNSGPLIVDQQTRTPVFRSSAVLPVLTVKLGKGKAESDEGAGRSRFVELLLAEKSVSCSEYDKYRVIKTAILGQTRRKIKDEETFVIQKKRLNYVSNPDKPTKLVLLVYEQKGQDRTYHTVMLSEDICVVEEHKTLVADSLETLAPYFSPIQASFLEKAGHQVGKISTLEPKYKIIEEVTTFENYLIKKNKKIWNIVYAAYKYSHMVDLYFLHDDAADRKDTFTKLWKNVYEEMKGLTDLEDSPLTCNFLHPAAKFVLKINAPPRNVRFFIKEKLASILSIVATDCEIEGLGTKWVKFDCINELKEVYLNCQAQVNSKILIEVPIPQSNPAPISAKPLSSPPQPQPEAHPKKVGPGHQKHDDEDFNEEDVEEDEDDVEYEGESSENYSVSNRKQRGRRVSAKKNNDKKHSQGGQGRESKYATRNRTTNRNREESDEEDKRATMQRKLREKEANTRAQANMPFRVLNPTQMAQMKQSDVGRREGDKIGGMMNMMFPMPMMKKPEDGKPGQPSQPAAIMMPSLMYPGGKPGGMMPMMMPMGQVPGMGQMMPMMMPLDKAQQQMMMGGMPMMMGGMPMGGGMPMMMGGMPQGAMMMPPGFTPMQPEDNKKDKKDSKEQQPQQPDLSKMMGMDMSKLMGGMGMPMMMGGFPQAMQMGMMAPGMGQGQPLMMMMNPNKDKDDKQNPNPMPNPFMMMQGQPGAMNPQQLQQMQQMMQQMGQMGQMAQMAQMGQPSTQQSSQQQPGNPSEGSQAGSGPTPQQIMSMMGGFPMMGGMAMPGMGMGQQGQQSQPMPMPLMMTPEMMQQLQRMTPQQQQQFIMQQMKNGGMMPFFGKPDPKDPSKK